MATGSYLSIITLNVNGLNVPTKRQRLAEWIQKQDTYIVCLQETHLKLRDTYRLKVKDWKVLCKKIILLGSSEAESFFLLKIFFNVVTLTFQLLKDYHLFDVPFYCSNSFAVSLKFSTSFK